MIALHIPYVIVRWSDDVQKGRNMSPLKKEKLNIFFGLTATINNFICFVTIKHKRMSCTKI
jgi:hypothetical protein